MEEVTGSSPVSTTTDQTSQEIMLMNSGLSLDLNCASLIEIADHYRAPKAPWVRANMITSQDGHFVGANNTSRDLTGPADFKLLLLLRALSDVVLVGAKTARLENYRQPKPRPEFEFLAQPAPRLAVVSESLEFDLDSNMFTGGQEPPIIINVGETHPSAELAKRAQVIPIAKSENFGIAIIATLSQIGLTKVTCEGGPKLLAEMLAADVVDEYDLTISPIQVGGTAQFAESLPADWDLVGTATADDYQFQRFFNKRVS